MKKLYFFVLSIVTTVMLVLFAFVAVNNVIHFTDLSEYDGVISAVKSYGPITLLCCYAFGSMLGRTVKVFIFIVAILALLVFAAVTFFPNWFTSII